MSIVVEKVSKTYGSQRALNGVSFEIGRGQIVGFLGPNGAGKSTMMKIIACYIPPNEGKVTVCGFDVMEQSTAAKRCIGYLPEHNPLYTDMYVREYLSFVGGMYKIPNLKTRVEEMIDTVGLQLEAHKKIEALSKGYRQRVGLAQALIHDPQVLILDEPTSGLDPNQLIEIRNLIISVGKTKTVMLSTHIMQEVEAMCDKAFIIDRGTIVANNLDIHELAKEGKRLEEIFKDATRKMTND
jgi:ABC-2 type transport system ATP-binding protein